MKTIEFEVVGWNWAQNPGKMKKGDQLMLEAEPHNPYDPFAVRVLHAQSRKFIGRVPASFTKDISMILKKVAYKDIYIEAVSRCALKISLSDQCYVL